MPQWVLTCPDCSSELTHSQIYVDDSCIRDPFTAFSKPELPDGGLKMACPNCQKTSIYLRHQLTYRAS
jgi:hypothetical protein